MATEIRPVESPWDVWLLYCNGGGQRWVARGEGAIRHQGFERVSGWWDENESGETTRRVGVQSFRNIGSFEPLLAILKLKFEPFLDQQEVFEGMITLRFHRSCCFKDYFGYSHSLRKSPNHKVVFLISEPSINSCKLSYSSGPKLRAIFNYSKPLFPRHTSFHLRAFFQDTRNLHSQLSTWKECLSLKRPVVTERCLSPESIMSKTGLGGWEKVAGVRPVNTREVEPGSMTAVIGRVMGRACERCIMVLSFHSSSDSDKTAV